MKLITHWLVYALAIAITAYIIPGIEITGFVNVLVLAIVLGAVNTFVRPILIILTLPLTIVTLGLFVFVINAVLIVLAGMVVPGFVVGGFLWALLFSVVLSIISSFLHRFTKDSNK